MAYTRVQFRDAIRARLGWSATDTFVTDAKLNSYVNDSLAELHSLLVTIFRPGSWGVTAEAVPVVVGTGTYSLNAANFGRLVAVRMLYENRLHVLQTFDIITEPLELNQRSWSPSTVRYVLGMGTSGPLLTFTPVPGSVVTILAYYVQAPPSFTADSDVSWMGFDEYVVLDCAAKCLRAEESDARPEEGAKEAYIARVKQQAEPLDIGQVATITDSRALDERPAFNRDSRDWFGR